MVGLTKYLALLLIAKPGEIVADEQTPFTAALANQQTPIKINTSFSAQGFSSASRISKSESAGTTSTNSEINTTNPLYPWLITSPYTGQDHLTNLSTLPLPSRLLTLALTYLEPTNSSYATTPYNQALNWPTIFTNLKSLSTSHNHTWTTTTFYVVEFRSQLKTGIDRDLLFKLDRESHREATASGGLLKYWFGRTSDDAEGRNLATCLWVKKEDAVAGGRGPMHKQARAVIPQMYESINVKGLKLTVGDDVSYWKFEPWVETF